MEGHNCPVLVSCKELKSEFAKFNKIPITSDNFSLGRGLKNSVVVPFLSISRNHCHFKKVENKWTLEDNSSFGIKVNGKTIGKGLAKTLRDGDVILLEVSEEFVYKFTCKSEEEFVVPRKRIKMDDSNENNKIIDDVKMKFEESQTSEIKHIEEKIQNAKQMQNTSLILKQQLQTEMNRKILQLESEFALQIENLKGEKNEVERQKTILKEERDAQLAAIKHAMENKISELMEQIQKHNETESELMKENNLLKEKLMKEREEFLQELNRENTSKQEILENLEAKIREQEDVRLKERQEFVEMLQRETEQLRLAKEKELKEIEEQRIQREQALKQELNNIKKNLEDKVQQTEQEKLNAEKMLNEQMEHMKKVSNEDKIAMQKLMKEREDIQNKLNEAQTNAAKSLEELRMRVIDRETELAALAAERIQKQAEQSSEVINTLQAQLEQVKSQLHTVEAERNTILENICSPANAGEGSSKQMVLTEMGELMESELQCSVCNELFVEATTLNCSHTFCKYCITVWKKKKKDCPICRAPITSECKSLVLDSFIEKMVGNLSEDMKRKRKDILDNRKELESELAQQSIANSNRRRNSADESTSEYSDFNDSEYYEEQEEEQEEDDYFAHYASVYDTDGSGFDSDAYDESELERSDLGVEREHHLVGITKHSLSSRESTPNYEDSLHESEEEPESERSHSFHESTERDSVSSQDTEEEPDSDRRHSPGETLPDSDIHSIQDSEESEQCVSPVASARDYDSHSNNESDGEQDSERSGSPGESSRDSDNLHSIRDSEEEQESENGRNSDESTPENSSAQDSEEEMDSDGDADAWGMEIVSNSDIDSSSSSDISSDNL